MPDAPSPKGRVAGGGPSARTLVVGSGFIGSHVVAELASHDRPPLVLTRSRPPDEIVRAVAPEDLHLGDATEKENVERALGDVAHVVYCAGGLLPAQSQDDPELDARLTLRPLQTVLAALHERAGVRLTYISSGGTVYGDPDELPVPESAPSRPRGSYGQLHLACEEEIERHRQEHGLAARILRCATVYGEYQWPDRGQGVIPTFLRRIERGQEIDLYGGDSTIRDYIYAGDVAKVVVALLHRDDGEHILNVGSGEGTSLTAVLRLIEKRLGRKALVNRHPEREFDVREIVLDVTRLRRLVDLEPISLEAGIERTHRWLAAQTPEHV